MIAFSEAVKPGAVSGRSPDFEEGAGCDHQPESDGGTWADDRSGVEGRTGADDQIGAEGQAGSSGWAEPADQAEADTEQLGNEIARLAAHIHAANHQLLVLIREFDRREGWGWGFRSCAEWLSWRTGASPGTSREKVRVARALEHLPLISAAMARGELSFSKVLGPYCASLRSWRTR